jgi:hypothetical protein
MSVLEQSVEPILAPLLVGLEPQRIEVDAQRTLAWWALKTCSPSRPWKSP